MSQRTTLGDFRATTIDGKDLDLGTFVGDVVLVVNTASQCGLTPQYEGLQRLYDTYVGRGFAVLGFPCDQFDHQEPGSEEEIAGFCERNYGVSFPMFAKIDVNGPDTHPLYVWLKEQKEGLLGGAVPVERWPSNAGVDVPALMDTLRGLVAELGRADLVDLCLGFVRAQPWLHATVVGTEHADQVRDLCLRFRTPVLTADECAHVVASLPQAPVDLLDPSRWTFRS